MSDKKTYRLVVHNGLKIECLLCKRLSENPHDVTQRYCPWCHRFHEDQHVKDKAVTP
jgi:hypothetical protein